MIRPAAPGDAPAIATILNALLSSTTIEWTETPHTDQSIGYWLEEHHTVLVAQEADQVVGVAALGWFRDALARPGYRFTVESTVHVREAHWGTGLGRALMEALIARARSSGMHVMVAAIDGANEASLQFHRHLGFTEVARMPEVGAKFGRWCDLVLLQLRLDDRQAPPGH